MPEFHVGDKVIEITSHKKGFIIEVLPPRRGRQLYQVMFEMSVLSETISETSLKFDFDISNPIERCKQGIFGDYSDFARKNTSVKIKNLSNNTISSLKASRTIFKAYQYKPLLKFLNSDNHRLLVADEVGLGKTIEAGHIMMEMKARNELRNVLIVCPKSLRLKWQGELKEKFGLDFGVFDDVKTLIEELRTRDGSFRAIITYERIRKSKNSKDNDVDSFLGFIQTYKKRFSLVLCDEAHRMRNHVTQTYKGAQILTSKDCAKAVVFLTATPIMIDEENLYNLLSLLDQDEYYDYHIFKNILELNKPFLNSLRQLKTKMSLSDMARELSLSSVTTTYSIADHLYPTTHIIDEYYDDDELYKDLIRSMRNENDTLELRAKLQYDLTMLSGMSRVFSRTRKREITTDWSQAERRPIPLKVRLNQDERERFDDVINKYIEDNSYDDYWGEVKMEQGKALGLVTMKRQVASSVYGFLNSVEDLDKGLDRFAEYPDAKVETLLNIIRQIDEEGENKLIVFGLFKNTLKYLAIRLQKAGINCEMIHGDVKDRDMHISRFKNDSNTKVLLSSEVGSEGLDMQFCSTMVNYDLPWNPMVVEQRIGRIDRFGQKSPVVKIFNLVVENSIQEEIYDRLLSRIGIFESSIGDLEAILDANFQHSGMSIQEAYQQLEKELFYNKLTKNEMEKKMDDISRAIQNEKENLKRIEDGLTNTLTDDSYFRNEINKILKNKAYLTESELQSFVELALRKALPNCGMASLGDDICQISSPKSKPRYIEQFLEAYQPIDDESQMQLAAFKAQIYEKSVFTLTFNQEKAFDDKGLIYVNMYHPLVQASFNYFEKESNASETTFSFIIPNSVVPKKLNGSAYFLVMYEIIVSQNVSLNVCKKTSNLLPVLYDIDNERVIDDEECAREFFGIAQTQGTYHTANIFTPLSLEMIDDMNADTVEYVDNYRMKKYEELNVRLKSRQASLLKQQKESDRARIENQRKIVEKTEASLDMLRGLNMEDEIKKQEQILRLQKSNLESMIEDAEKKEQDILMDSKLSVDKKLVSINLITLE